MSFFENLVWGWSNKRIEASDVFPKGGEVYITQACPGKNQTFFDSFEGKSLIGILGYHYGFANYNADIHYLESEFNITLFNDPASIIIPVAQGRIDIGIVTISFLNKYLNQNPNMRKTILISDKLDQEYDHTILVRKDM